MQLDVLDLLLGISARSKLLESVLFYCRKWRKTEHSARSKPLCDVTSGTFGRFSAFGWPILAHEAKSEEKFARTKSAKMNLVNTGFKIARGETSPVINEAPLMAHRDVADVARMAYRVGPVKDVFSKSYGALRNQDVRHFAVVCDEMSRTNSQCVVRTNGETG